MLLLIIRLFAKCNKQNCYVSQHLDQTNIEQNHSVSLSQWGFDTKELTFMLNT